MRHPLPAVAVAALAISFVATGRAATAPAVPKCPAHAPKFTSVMGTSKPFVETGAQAVRLCRYYKINWADSQGLWRQALVQNHSTVVSLTHGFNVLKEPPRGIFCVKDNGSEILALFAYSGAKPERVVVKLSGCRFVSNGKATRSLSRTLHSRLVALTKK